MTIERTAIERTTIQGKTLQLRTNQAKTSPGKTNPGTQPGADGGDLGVAPRESELLQSQLALFTDIEDCLRAVENALLLRNLEHLDEATARLARYRAELKKMPPIAGSEPAIYPTSGVRQLREAQLRVLHRGRVEAALLARMQRSLAAVSNLLAIPSRASYGPPAPDGTLALVLEDPSGDYRCRV
jgi:hypothetical protein